MSLPSRGASIFGNLWHLRLCAVRCREVVVTTTDSVCADAAPEKAAVSPVEAIDLKVTSNVSRTIVPVAASESMNQRIRLTLIFLTILSVPALSSAAEITSLRMGFAGVGKVGKWLPISVTASDLPANVEVDVRASFVDPRGDHCIQTVATSKTASDGTVSVAGCFCVGRLLGSGEVTLIESKSGDVLCSRFVRHGDTNDFRDDSAIQESVQLYRLNVPLLLTFGEVAGIPELLRNAEEYSDRSVVLKGTQLEAITALPDQARALECIDSMLMVSRFDATATQTNAVRRWVESGGDLYFSVGGNVGEFLTSEPGRWLNQFFELQPEALSIRELSSLQSFVPGASRLETGRRTVPIAISRSDQNQEEVGFLSGPIVARQGVGAGTATFVAVDVNERPMDRWLSLPQFYEVLILGDKLSRTSGSTARSSRISQSGISELATQLMAALDATPAEGVWSTWSIMAMMIVWLALIGPVDYFLVSRVLKRPHLTWLTFPALIIAGVALISAATGGRVSDTLNQLHIVDVFNQSEGSSCRSRSWMSYSSTQTARRDLTATSQFIEGLSAAPRLIWSGRPEDVYGGMYRAGGIGLGRQDYSHSESEASSLQSLPVLTKGSRQLLAEWAGQSETRLIESSLEASGYGLLNGTFQHHLPGEITDFVIFHGNRVYQMESSKPTLSPGESWQARQPGVRASDLKAFLNGAVLVRSDKPTQKASTQTATPYNSSSRDPQYILTMATFFEIAGGSKYVGLSQEYLRHMELSDTIRLNHAVLIGTMVRPATGLQIDGESITASKSTTLVRLLLPVNRRPAGRMMKTEDEIKQEMERDDSPLIGEPQVDSPVENNTDSKPDGTTDADGDNGVPQENDSE